MKKIDIDQEIKIMKENAIDFDGSINACVVNKVGDLSKYLNACLELASDLKEVVFDGYRYYFDVENMVIVVFSPRYDDVFFKYICDKYDFDDYAGCIENEEERYVTIEVIKSTEDFEKSIVWNLLDNALVYKVEDKCLEEVQIVICARRLLSELARTRMDSIDVIIK